MFDYPTDESESNLSKKIKFLKHLHKSYGDFTIAYINKLTGEVWPRWKNYSECNGAEIEQANLRALMPDEVMFDIESEESHTYFLQKVDETGIKLKSLWKSGSKGWHGNAIYKELDTVSEAQRIKIREDIIREYKTDPAKKAGLIALEYSPHFKTGVPKSILEKYDGGDNKIPLIIPPEVESKIKSVSSDPLVERIKAKIKMSDMLKRYGVNNVPQRNKGNCMCPFDHPSESRACFSFDNIKGMGHCFSCGAGVDIISMMEKKESLTFTQARDRLCEELGIEDNKVTLPKEGKLISEFTEECLQKIDKTILFNRPEIRSIVEIGYKEGNGEDQLGFDVVAPSRFITVMEKHITPGVSVKVKDSDAWVFKKKSINKDLATTMLESEILQEGLPQMRRIFTVPTPIIREGALAFPKEGYDSRFDSWVPFNAPKINEGISLEDAKKTIDYMLEEFCFETEKDKTNAIASIITPFLRGLYTNFRVRTPLFMYIANRERAGKDYLADLRMLIYTGSAIEEAPLNSGSGHNSEELRKKLLSSLVAGKRFLHFANNKGNLDSGVFEQILTSPKYEDRMLGRNEIVEVNNELEFSLSGNTGITFSADLSNRSKVIRLHLDIEDANKREFKNPDLHKWVLDNRDQVLSSIYALVKHWDNNGRPPGTVPFTSFHEWASICGGVMESCGYDNPCTADTSLQIGGDDETAHMKELFERCYEMWPSSEITKNELLRVCQPGDGEELSLYGDNFLFPELKLEERSGQTKFGKVIHKFVGRILSGIKLSVANTGTRSTRQKYKFVKVDDVPKGQTTL